MDEALRRQPMNVEGYVMSLLYRLSPNLVTYSESSLERVNVRFQVEAGALVTWWRGMK